MPGTPPTEASRAPSGRGRPPMTERRREIVRTQIARAAVRLFTENGVSGTTGDDIAHALGISTRTLWRYFPTKESCVRPLLTTGLEHMAERLRACPADTPLLEFLERERFFDGEPQVMEGPVADLIRMTRSEPALMAVWLEVHHAAESVFARIIADRTGEPADGLPVRVQAAALNSALRLAAEERARLGGGEDGAPPESAGDEGRGAPQEGTGSPGMGPLLRTALTIAARGLPAFGHDHGNGDGNGNGDGRRNGDGSGSEDRNGETASR